MFEVAMNIYIVQINYVSISGNFFLMGETTKKKKQPKTKNGH